MKNLWVLAVFALVVVGCNNDIQSQSQIDEELILDYIEKNNLDATKHSSGLYYVIDEPGSGGSPSVSSTIKIQYKFNLLDGTLIQESDAEGIVFPLNSSILGWKFGIPLFQIGGKGKLLIPSGLGYGVGGLKGDTVIVPSNSVLVYDIHLFDFY